MQIIHWFPGSGMASEIAQRPGAKALCGAPYKWTADEKHLSADHPYQITCEHCERLIESRGPFVEPRERISDAL